MEIYKKFSNVLDSLYRVSNKGFMRISETENTLPKQQIPENFTGQKSFRKKPMTPELVYKEIQVVKSHVTRPFNQP